MSSWFYTRLRPQLKRVTTAMGFKRSTSKMPRELPWDFDEQAAQIFKAVNDYTMTSPECVYALVNAVRYVVANRIEGDFVECGVWRGGSAMAVALALNGLGEQGRHLHLYDTYSGMTAPTAEDVDFNGKPALPKFAKRQLSEDSSEWCRSPLDDVKASMARTGYPPEKIHYIEGRVEDTLPARAPPGKISILRLDTDWYKSTRHELEQLYPSLSQGGVLLLDDYGHWQGARKAVDEYIAEQRLPLLLNRIDNSARIATKP